MIEIDGSHGEGGGQIIRSSLALSAVTGKAFRVTNIRAGRKKPGLKRQHVTCVSAAREICGAGVSGADLHSNEFTFAPGGIQPRDFHFKIGSAGSSTLVAQTVLPALMIADRPSSVTVDGGTHNFGAPPYDFLERVYLPQVRKLGPGFTIEISSYGFVPVGGGRLKIQISPQPALGALCLEQRELRTNVTATALVSMLPSHIGARETEVVRRKANLAPAQCRTIEIENSPGPGNVLMIEMNSGNVNEIVTGFGSRGVRAEDVAGGAFREAKPYLENTYPVGEHLADQLLLPLGLSAAQGNTNQFITGPLSLHGTTHIDILKLFLPIEIEVEPLGKMLFRVILRPNLKHK